MTWQQWVSHQMERNGWTHQVDVVRASNGQVKKSVVSRWLDPAITERPHPDNCRKAAEVFNTSILEAYVAAGYLTAEEANMSPSPPRRSLRQLLNEAQMEAARIEEENQALRGGGVERVGL